MESVEPARFSERLRGWAEHVDPVAGFYGPGSITWKVNREAAIYLGGMRALLMQIAHPKVARGVAEHVHRVAPRPGRRQHRVQSLQGVRRQCRQFTFP